MREGPSPKPRAKKTIRAPWDHDLTVQTGLMTFEDLPHDCKNASDQARTLLSKLPKEFPEPQIWPIGRGDIILYWFNGVNRVDGSFERGDRFLWLGKFGGIYTPEADEKWDGVPPPGFVKLLGRLYG